MPSGHQILLTFTEQLPAPEKIRSANFFPVVKYHISQAAPDRKVFCVTSCLVTRSNQEARLGAAPLSTLHFRVGLGASYANSHRPPRVLTSSAFAFRVKAHAKHRGNARRDDTFSLEKVARLKAETDEVIKLYQSPPAPASSKRKPYIPSPQGLGDREAVDEVASQKSCKSLKRICRATRSNIKNTFRAAWRVASLYNRPATHLVKNDSPTHLTTENPKQIFFAISYISSKQK